MCVKWGATVFLPVSRELVGPMLRRFEHCPDVFILARRGAPDEVWELRSDAFPAHWEQSTIRAEIKKGNPGIADFHRWN